MSRSPVYASKPNSSTNPSLKFQQKSFDQSVNIEQVMRQNDQLKQNIQQLIQQNNQLTQIIQELSNQHQNIKQNMPNLNQEELEALAHQVIELQQELEMERQKKQKTILQNEGDAEQTIKIIEELSTEFQAMQQHYQMEIQKLQSQLAAQKGQCKMILETTESKFNKTLDEYKTLLNQLKLKNEIITGLEAKLSQISHPSKKELKISTTIEDLRLTLEKQIEEKENTIKMYENLIKNLRVKLMEK